MRIELLPSSLPPSAAQFLVSFLVDDEIVIDAGAIGLLADLDRQRRVRHVFLTHEHLDHVASLPILLENVYEPGRQAVEVLASAHVLDVLQRDLFSGRLWPDFFALSRSEAAFLQPSVVESLRPVHRAGLAITPVPVSHGVPTLGYVVSDGSIAVAFPSDTGPTAVLWDHLRGVVGLRAVFLEVSFPDALADLAAATGHHCPATFAVERKKIPADVRCIVVHRKARYAETIARELAALDLPNVELVRPGHAYEW